MNLTTVELGYNREGLFSKVTIWYQIIKQILFVIGVNSL